MSNQTITEFHNSLKARLEKKDYGELPPAEPLEIAFLKRDILGSPYVFAVVDTGTIANTPTEIFLRVEKWFQTLIGRSGAGVLLFVYHSPPAITTIEEIQKIGSGGAGNGQVIAGAHDLKTGRHWLSNHMGWEQTIYED